MEASTVYYARAYATNSKGTSYGNEISFTTASVDVTTGLVAYYPFNGNANDESGNGNHGIVNGATLTSDRSQSLNKAFYFDGISNFIDLQSISLNISGNQNRTISLWVNPNNSEFKDMNLIAFGTPNYSQAFNIRLNTHLITRTSYRLGFMSFANDFDPFYNSEGGIPILNSDWYNLTVVYDNSFIKLFINGSIIESSALTISTQGNQNFIGKSNHVGSDNHFQGVIDDIRIYNRALTQSEITYLATH